MTSVGLFGAGGFLGQALLRRLRRHPKVSTIVAFSSPTEHTESLALAAPKTQGLNEVIHVVRQWGALEVSMRKAVVGECRGVPVVKEFISPGLNIRGLGTRIPTGVITGRFIELMMRIGVESWTQITYSGPGPLDGDMEALSSKIGIKTDVKAQGCGKTVMVDARKVLLGQGIELDDDIMPCLMSWCDTTRHVSSETALASLRESADLVADATIAALLDGEAAGGVVVEKPSVETLEVLAEDPSASSKESKYVWHKFCSKLLRWEARMETLQSEYDFSPAAPDEAGASPDNIVSRLKVMLGQMKVIYERKSKEIDELRANLALEPGGESHTKFEAIDKKRQTKLGLMEMEMAKVEHVISKVGSAPFQKPYLVRWTPEELDTAFFKNWFWDPKGLFKVAWGLKSKSEKGVLEGGGEAKDSLSLEEPVEDFLARQERELAAIRVDKRFWRTGRITDILGGSRRKAVP